MFIGRQKGLEAIAWIFSLGFFQAICNSVTTISWRGSALDVRILDPDSYDFVDYFGEREMCSQKPIRFIEDLMQLYWMYLLLFYLAGSYH